MKRRNFVNPRGAPASRDRHVYGVHPVTEWLRTCPAHLTSVQYDEQSARRLAPMLHLVAGTGIPLHPCDDRTLTALAGTPRHQGVVATVLPFPYAELDQVLSVSPRLVLVVDQMQDPHNLGALLRSGAAAGAGAVILPKDGAAAVTASVEASAAGAAAVLPVCRVTNTARTLQTLKEQGYWSVGLIPREGVDLYHFEAPNRIALVIGGETGMRPLVVKHCDMLVSIPMFSRIESLNASVAVAVALFELRRRWGEEGGGRP